MKKGNNKNHKKGAKVEAIRNGKGKFTFPNGDSYEGEYIVINNKEIYRHGRGIYTTSDNDKYHATWDKDSISSDIHIRYGNKAEYCGPLNSEGAMTGKGTYIFPDSTALNAIWVENEPMADYAYKDALGNGWLGKLSMYKPEVIFTAENRIWDEKIIR